MLERKYKYDKEKTIQIYRHTYIETIRTVEKTATVDNKRGIQQFDNIRWDRKRCAKARERKIQQNQRLNRRVRPAVSSD